jgi:hypothetical protein
VPVVEPVEPRVILSLGACVRLVTRLVRKWSEGARLMASLAVF